MVLKSIRWLYGYTTVDFISGAFEQFLSLAAKRDINLWDIKKTGQILRCRCLKKDKEKIFEIAKISGGVLEILETEGLPYFISKYKKRVGALIGIIIFFTILWVLSLFIWNIEINGAENIQKEQILQAASELGIKKGTWKAAIDADVAGQQLMAKLPDIAWVSININASNATINIKEKAKTPEFTVSDGTPCNIISKIDAQVERVETFGGTALVQPGEVVVKGQVLISGIMENLDGIPRFTSADGKIVAKTKKIITEKIKLHRLEAVDTGEKVTILKSNFFGFEFPINFWQENPGENYRQETDIKNFQILGYSLPFFFTFEKFHKQEIAEITVNYDEAFKIAQKNTESRAEFLLENLQILDIIEEKKENTEEFILETTYFCLEEIGERVKLEAE